MNKEIEEKAKELIYKYIDEISGDCENGCETIILFNAKQCALICVDEIIQALKYHTWQNNKLIEYWKQVKQEINKQ